MGKVLDNRLDNLNAIFDLTPVSTSELIKQKLQYAINDKFEKASDVYTIQEETDIGTLEYQDIVIRITHAIDITTGTKLGDDFRQIIFKDMTHVFGLGRRYFFDDNVWITVNSDTYHYPTISTTIRRANNTLNFYLNNVLKEEPCIIDYNPSKINTNYKLLPTQDGRLYIIAQWNDTTKNVYVNQRFLFGKQAYRIVYIDNLQLSKTFDLNSCLLVEFYADKVDISSNDDFVNNIAYNSSDEITEDNDVPETGKSNIIDPLVDRILISESQAYTVYSYENGIKTSNTFTISVLNVPSTYYYLNITDGNHFTLVNLKTYIDGLARILCKNNTNNTEIYLDVELAGEF